MPQFNFRHRPLFPIATLAFSLALAMLFAGGCDEMSGTYAGSGGSKIEFDGHHAYVTLFPAPAMQAEYEVDADKVIIRASGDPIILTLTGDTLEGGSLGMTFIRQAPHK